MLVVHEDRQVLVPQAQIPLEQQLHDLLEANPMLLPLDDMGLGPSVVVAKEAPLAAGRADLVLVDDRGQICIVEVKKDNNPDTRLVIAQLIDYAASMWKMTVEEFESNVFDATIGRATQRRLPELLSSTFDAAVNEDGSNGSHGSQVLGQVEANLREGDFLLAVAAPTIPTRLRSAMEYQNEKENRFYGIEFSYFFAPEGTQCLVPQLVVAPPVKNQPGVRDLQKVVEASGEYREFVLELTEAATSAGAELKPTTSDWVSVVIRTPRGGVTPCFVGATAASVAILNPGEKFPNEPFIEAGRRLEQTGLGAITGKAAMYRRVDFGKVPKERLSELTAIVGELCKSLSTS